MPTRTYQEKTTIRTNDDRDLFRHLLSNTKILTSTADIEALLPLVVRALDTITSLRPMTLGETAKRDAAWARLNLRIFADIAARIDSNLFYLHESVNPVDVFLLIKTLERSMPPRLTLEATESYFIDKPRGTEESLDSYLTRFMHFHRHFGLTMATTDHLYLFASLLAFGLRHNYVIDTYLVHEFEEFDPDNFGDVYHWALSNLRNIKLRSSVRSSSKKTRGRRSRSKFTTTTTHKESQSQN